MKKTYITTSIAYVNAEPHIGFLYEILAADVLKRYRKSLGEDVFFVTGTDEHGIKVAQAAVAAGKKEQEYVDEASKKFENLGEEVDIDWDYFIRTTNSQHIQFVQKKWQQLEKAGLLKKNKYSGLYCQGCEAFKTEGETNNGKCVIHERVLEKIEEENWFLQIQDLKPKIQDWINEAVFPKSRRQEALNVLNSGAYDEISVSRSKERYGWGVPVPGDEGQIMYVWTDALFNYLSALEISGKQTLWPADTQIIGKDILKFHAIIWPALLLACGYDLPQQLLVHGFINIDGKKMSKSLGNVVSPSQLLERYGAEATRYLMFRQLAFYEDSNFTWDDFDSIYNGELANGLGNLVNRSVNLLKTFKVKNVALDYRVEDSELADADFAGELRKVNELIAHADQWISEVKPWEWVKEGDVSKDRIDNFFEQVRLPEIAARLEPFMPQTAQEIRRQIRELEPKPLFPRLIEK